MEDTVVVVLPLARTLVLSFERVAGVLVGSHAFVREHEADEVLERVRALRLN